MRHVLVTNDFPPKVGGIQSYLWELWRRLPPDEVTVLTTSHAGDAAFDAVQPFRVERTGHRWLLPTPGLLRRIEELCDEVGAELVVLDPALPLGLLGPKLSRPYVVIGHGAELVIPHRLPPTDRLMRYVLQNAKALIASGGYVARSMREASDRHDQPVAVVPPGVDVDRFRPIGDGQREAVRARWGVRPESVLVVGISRLVPRKGFDRLVRAARGFDKEDPPVEVLIAGKGREFGRLSRLVARTGSHVRLLGRITEEELTELHGAADIFCMPCHDRWFGLEQEGFGIVFVEASASGVPVIAGTSGGSAEAVVDGATGLVIGENASARSISKAIKKLVADPDLRRELGEKGRARAVSELSYEHLAAELEDFLRGLGAPAD